MHRKIVVSALAQSQLEAIANFWVQHNGNDAYSLRFVAAVFETLNRAALNPGIGRLSRIKHVRVKLVLRRYLLAFKSTDHQMELLACVDGRS